MGSRGQSFIESRTLACPLLPIQLGPPTSRGPRAICKIDRIDDLMDSYEVQGKLCETRPETLVIQAICRASGQHVIIKACSKKFAVGGEQVWRSLLTRMLNMETHHNVLGLLDVLEDAIAYYLVMEKCDGGELLHFLNTAYDVPERECKRIMREILEAVHHIHCCGLLHRDIKPENILFHDTTADPSTPLTLRAKKTVKLIDFDSCVEYKQNRPKPTHVVGTLRYLAPEALRGEYSPASDLWSVGIILYILMTGTMPFNIELDNVMGIEDVRCGSASMEGMYQTLRNTHIDFECEPWPTFPQARDLCRKLLAASPGDRSPSASAALSHPWLHR